MSVVGGGQVKPVLLGYARAFRPPRPLLNVGRRPLFVVPRIFIEPAYGCYFRRRTDVPRVPRHREADIICLRIMTRATRSIRENICRLYFALSFAYFQGYSHRQLSHLSCDISKEYRWAIYPKNISTHSFRLLPEFF